MVEDTLNPNELEDLFDWITSREYEDITWEDFLDNPQRYVDLYFDRYTDWLAEAGKDL